MTDETYAIKLFAIGFIIGFMCLFYIHFSPVGYGLHTGYITAIESRGYLFQNYVVYFKTDTSSSQEDIYCVSHNNKDLFTKLREASKINSKITINFHGVRAFGLGICTGSQIDNIDLAF
jgi:hypothetical protein